MNNRSLLFACLAFLVSPAFCLGAPKKLPDLKDADAFVTKAFGEDCDRHPTGEIQPLLEFDARFDIAYKRKTDTEDRVFPLFQMYCNHGLNWEENVYLTLDKHGKFKIIFFDDPKIKYEHEDEQQTKLKYHPKITSMGSTNMLANTEFDPETNSMVSSSSWSPFGDAYKESTYEFSEGKFVLKRLVVDVIWEKNLPEAEQAALAYKTFTLIPAE